MEEAAAPATPSAAEAGEAAPAPSAAGAAEEAAQEAAQAAAQAVEVARSGQAAAALAAEQRAEAASEAARASRGAGGGEAAEGRGAADAVESARELPEAPAPAAAARRPVSRAPWAQGDLVRIAQGLGHGALAVVTEVQERHCTVVLLDEARSRGLGELWPFYEDLQLVSSAWRLGAAVVIQGLTSKKLEHLNGLSGRVGRHPKQGHPALVQRSHAEEPQLRLVVLMDDAKAAGNTSVFVEARFLMSPEAYTLKLITEHFGDAFGQQEAHSEGQQPLGDRRFDSERPGLLGSWPLVSPRSSKHEESQSLIAPWCRNVGSQG